MDNETTGPIDYLVVEFPDGKPGRAGFDRLLEVVDHGHIRVLDLELIAKDTDGTVHAVDPTSLDADGVGAFDGASSGLLDAGDLAVLGHDMAAGALAVVLIYEELTLAPVLAAWTAGGARELTAGPLAEADIVAALDHTETA